MLSKLFLTSAHQLALVILVFIAVPTYEQTTAPSTAPPSSDVQVKLLITDNKKSFRIGEPVRMVMEFTSTAPGYRVDTIPDQKSLTSDSITISPDSGVSHWLDEMTRGWRHSRDYFAPVEITGVPTRVGITLNDSLRFDRPGHYTVKVTTQRVTTPARGTTERARPIKLTTNAVQFDVVPMTEIEEEREVKRLSELLNTKRDLQTDENVGQELSFLTGDSSALEKLRRFLNPEERSGNYNSHISYGLYIARNRDLVLQRLEEALRDPKQAVGWSLISAASNLRLIKENAGVRYEPKASMLSPESDPRLDEIRNGYITELAVGLGKRSGSSLTTTALTILTMSKKGTENWTALTREARRVLVQQFDSLHPFSQDHLLQMYWDDVRDPSMVISLKKVLASKADKTKYIRKTVLKRLIDLSSDEARPYVLAEICEPMSLVDTETLGGLNDKSLPEVDNCLLAQLKRLTGSKVGRDQVFMGFKAALAVRYATENIYQEIMQLYLDNLPSLSLELRATLLAYLAKHNESEALPLIEQTVADLKPDQDHNFLPKLTKLYYSPRVGDLLKERLEKSEPAAASHAAYLLGLHGGPGDELVLQRRLERFRKEWKDRVTEADSTFQGRIERELLWALLNGKAWKLPPERMSELKQSCVTTLCRQSIR